MSLAGARVWLPEQGPARWLHCHMVSNLSVTLTYNNTQHTHSLNTPFVMQHSVILIKPCPYTPSLDGIYSKWPQSSSLMKWDHGYQREWTCTHTFSSVGFFFGSVLLQCVVSEATVLISQVKSADCVNFFVWSCTVEQLEDSSVRIFLGNSLPLVPVLLHLFFFWALHTLFTASSHLGQCKASATKSAILDRASLLLHMWVWNC